MRLKASESQILRQILDGLAAKRIFAIRMNSGGMFGKHKGKGWAVRFGRKGTADVLAIRKREFRAWYRDYPYAGFMPFWIECKRPGQKQTPAQKLFQQEVEAEGHRYILASDWTAVEKELG